MGHKKLSLTDRSKFYPDFLKKLKPSSTLRLVADAPVVIKENLQTMYPK